MQSWFNLLLIIAIMPPLWLAATVAEWALTPALVQHDDTDPPDSHSGLTLYTDNLTGCQYLSVHGALTPRRDRQGQPVCINR